MVKKSTQEILRRAKEKKEPTKGACNIYLDKDLWDDFKAWCDENEVKPSRIIEEWIKSTLGRS